MDEPITEERFEEEVRAPSYEQFVAYLRHYFGERGGPWSFYGVQLYDFPPVRVKARSPLEAYIAFYFDDGALKDQYEYEILGIIDKRKEERNLNPNIRAQDILAMMVTEALDPQIITIQYLGPAPPPGNEHPAPI